MKTDYSKLMYDKYFSLQNKNIEIKLKSGKKISGIIIGFFKGYEYSNEPYILQWHIADQSQSAKFFSIDDFGEQLGVIVDTAEISEVKFLQDNSTIKFQ